MAWAEYTGPQNRPQPPPEGEQKAGEQRTDQVRAEVEGTRRPRRDEHLVQLVGAGVRGGEEERGGESAVGCLPCEGEEERELGGMEKLVDMREERLTDGDGAMRYGEDRSGVQNEKGGPESSFHRIV